MALAGRPKAEVHHLEPEPDGVAVILEHPDERIERIRVRWQDGAWHRE